MVAAFDDSDDTTPSVSHFGSMAVTSRMYSRLAGSVDVRQTYCRESRGSENSLSTNS
jgi:hypothetical protein